MDGQSDLVAQGTSDNLGDAVEGIRRVLGKGEARTQRVEKLALEVGVEQPKDVVPQDGILGLIGDGHVNLTVTRHGQVSKNQLSSKGTNRDELPVCVSRKVGFTKEGPNGPGST